MHVQDGHELPLVRHDTDAYQAECERFDAAMEKADGDVFACRHDLLQAAETREVRALLDRLVEAGEAAADARNRGSFHGRG